MNTALSTAGVLASYALQERRYSLKYLTAVKAQPRY
jgi:hypothetical protein